MRECFFGSHSVPPTLANVLGVLSLIIYSLLIVISVKYIAIVMRADNHGEGGILALTALLPQLPGGGPKWPTLLLLGIFGAALLYGDGMITPAITVLGAVEGLKLATPLFEPYVVPVTVGILIGVFAIQSHGTDRVGKLFGPVMVVWFLVIASLGIMWLVRAPVVLTAIDPRHAVAFFQEHRLHGFAVLGAVFLVVTGGEALYADMGHFGKRPIRVAWFGLVLPALLLNYFGQGALLDHEPEGDRAAVLPAGAVMGAVSARRTGDRRGDHRVAGADLRRVLADAPGDSARLLPAPGHRAHLVAGDRPGLRAAGQLGADDLHHPDRDRLRVVDGAGRRLRHRRHAHDGDHGRPALRRRDGALALAARRGRAGHGSLSRHRSRVLRRERAEDRARRLAAARDRLRCCSR